MSTALESVGESKDMFVLDPLIYRMVTIPVEQRVDPEVEVAYTDCVESSFMRFFQLVLHDLEFRGQCASVRGRIDLGYLTSICDDQELIGFFTQWPEIHDAEYYDEGHPGYAIRTEWCAFLTRRNERFQYVRTPKNQFLDDVVSDGDMPPAEMVFQYELDATVHNHISVFAASFPGLRSALPSPLSIVEDLEDSSVYAPLFEALASFFSRPGFTLRISLDQLKRFGLSSFWFSSLDLRISINGIQLWIWTISRRKPEKSPINLGAHSQIDLDPRQLLLR